MQKMTRRTWHGLVVGGLVSGPLGAALGAQKPDSTIAGVRLGSQSYSFRDRRLDEVISSMRTVGLAFCELWQEHIETRERIGAPAGASRTDRRAALRNWRLTVPLAEFEQIRKKFDAAGVTLTAYNLSFQDDFTDEEIRRGFEMARALGVDVITASANTGVVPRVDKVAKEFRIRVGMHNHSRIAPNEFATPDDFAKAMSGTSDLIAVNLDIGHFTAANFDAVDYLDTHHDRIVSLHIKDRKREQGPNVPFGEGDSPIIAVLQRLRDRRWAIPAQIEYEYEGQDTIAEVRRCLEYCRKALEG